MKTIKYLLNIKVLLVFVASMLIFSCSDEEEGTPTYLTTPGQSVLILPLNNQECEQGEVVDNMADVTFSW